jgi:hypothetical protein
MLSLHNSIQLSSKKNANFTIFYVEKLDKINVICIFKIIRLAKGRMASSFLYYLVNILIKIFVNRPIILVNNQQRDLNEST